MTPAQCKKIIADQLRAMELQAYKLTAKTVSFSDLARGACVFVKIHNWQDGTRWSELKAIAKANGFCIE